MADAGAFERAYFEANYRDYERQNPPRKLAFYRGLVERAVQGVARPRVLDVGCAFGAFLGALDPRWERCGADVSAYAIERARAAHRDIAFAQGAATEIPFPGPFDAITAFDVIEHVPDLERVAAAVRAKLTEAGHFIFVVPVYDGVTGPAIRLLDHDETHVHKRSRAFWLRWADEHFTLVEWWGVLRYLLPGGAYLHRPTRAFRGATPAIAAVARAKRSTTS